MGHKVKTLALIALAVTSIGTATGVAAATQNVAGGIWTYGATRGGAFSNFYHGQRYHGSTVVSRKDSSSSRAEAPAGATSKAFLSTGWGEKVAFYYRFEQ